MLDEFISIISSGDYIVDDNCNEDFYTRDRLSLGVVYSALLDYWIIASNASSYELSYSAVVVYVVCSGTPVVASSKVLLN